MISELSGFFRDVKSLKEYLPGYEFRESQLKMAESIFQSFMRNNNLLIEAPSGTGKSLSYLAAAVKFSEETCSRIVISTYTKTLQNQLFYKDLPLMEKVLGHNISFALAIGSTNYLCRRRLNERIKRGMFLNEGNKEYFLDWVSRTKTGLFTDLDIDIPAKLRNVVRRDRETCSTAGCSFRKDCFYFRARRKLKKASIIITNHSMLFTDLSSGADILPAEYALLMDEAHTAEDAARDKFSDQISISTFKRYSDRALAYLSGMEEDNLFSNVRELVEHLKKTLFTLDQKVDGLCSSAKNIVPKNEKIILRKEEYKTDSIYSHLEISAQLWAEILASKTDEEKDEYFMAQALLAWTEDLMCLIKEIFWEDKKTRVYWQESRMREEGSDFRFHSTVLDVGEELKEKLFDVPFPRVLASATMTTGSLGDDPFSYIKDSLGLDHPEELILPEVFDHKNNVYLYIPDNMADPQGDFKKYRAQTVQQIIKTYDVVDGGIFVLFTSYSMLNYCARSLSLQRPDIETLKQGDLPRYVLLDIFKSKKEKTVLLGTTSFWQGVDVSGTALQAVIITRLPFAVPTDPIVKMKIARLNSLGRNAFMEYQLPKSLIMFKQGFGRLIRGQNDFGVVVVLDPRIRTRRYGNLFLKVLPDMKIENSLSTLPEFLKEQTAFRSK